jgi:hypothetical protein
MRKLVFTVVIISPVFVGCQYELNCAKFKNGIGNNDNELVRNEIDRLCADLYPNVTASDPQGQQENIVKLSNRINENCGITSTVECYNCIYTNPPQSEIRIDFLVDTVPFTKYLDIIGTSGHMLKFADMHD